MKLIYIIKILNIKKNIIKYFLKKEGTVMNKFIKEWMSYVIIIVVVVLIRTYIVTPVIVRGDSMYSTLKDGEVLFLSKITYRVSDIKRFDIVVVKDLDDDLIIKRVIGLPGDSVEYKDGILYVNNKEIKEKYADYVMEDFDVDSICKITDLECNGIIPDNMYLVLGDNREISADSRAKGLIKENQILGKTIFRIWPLNNISLIK